ncbi:MAG: ATP-binding protein, partial [Anaerolineae bacterium]
LAGEPAVDAWPVLASRGLEIEAKALGSRLATCPRCADILAGRADAGGGPAAAIRCRQEPAGALAQAGLQSLVCLPLVAHEHVLGVLTLAWEGQHGLVDSDETLLLAVEQQIALGLRNAQLHSQVHALLRQREATQALLVQNEKVAALGRLTASLSHEINNPLQSVLGCLALAEEGLDSADGDDSIGTYLDVAIKEIQRIAALVRRMREFYAPRSQEPILADVENVLSAVVDLTQVELTNRDVAIEWQHGGWPQRVTMRPDQLQQVFLNLLLNAAEAMPAGGTVTLRIDRDEMPRGEGGSALAVRVDVQDTGEGMSPEVQQRLFEPFFTTKSEGSGLGLYICHRIIREHGGEIEVHGREGEGTTVSIWLPAPTPE